MTSFLAVSLPPDFCPDKTGEFLSVPIGSRKVRLETDWKITGIVRKHPTGIRRQRTSQKRLGNGRKRWKPAGSDTEIAGTGRLFEVPATGLIDLGAWEQSINVRDDGARGTKDKDPQIGHPLARASVHEAKRKANIDRWIPLVSFISQKNRSTDLLCFMMRTTVEPVEHCLWQWMTCCNKEEQ